jgi:hypothetical protein
MLNNVRSVIELWASRAADEQVDDGADGVCEGDEENPHQLVARPVPIVIGTDGVDESPHPHDEAADQEEQKDEGRERFQWRGPFNGSKS